MKSHARVRSNQKWRSYGIDGQGPVVDIIIKDIGDEHLLNIIRHIEERALHNHMLSPIYHTMHAEIAWRLRGIWIHIL